MASAGFSAAKSYWGTITGLSPKSSSDGKASSNAEALNEYGDTTANDVYGELLNPTTEFAVTAEVSLSSLPALGSVVTDSSKKLMVTKVEVKTSNNAMPTVTISGVEVESAAASKRTYSLSGSVKPRAKAQDVCSAFTANTNFTAIDTTFSVDPHVQTVAGDPVASDASHGVIEVSGTLTDATGSQSITAASDFTLTSVESQSAPDADYISRQATATKYLTGSESSSNA